MYKGKILITIFVLVARIQFSQTVPLLNTNDSEISAEEIVGNLDEQGSYFEGDIKMDPDEIDALLMLHRKSGIQGKTYRWTDNTVVYKIDGEFTDDELNILNDAMKLISSKTCLKFKKRNKEKNYISIDSKEKGCFSTIGMRGGKQQMNLDKNCFTRGPGTPAHEFIHAIGFFHEQSRTDRDDYVNIIWENIKEPEKHNHNFDKYTNTKVWSFGISYDYNSIMHYSSKAFTKNRNLNTIVVKNVRKRIMIGQRQDLSKKDVKKINAMYKCNKN